MSWKQLLDNRDVQRHQTSKQELDNIRKLIIRDLADASITALSADRRFATAYNAALQAAAMTVLCSGYRVSARAGHHQITFEAAHLAIGHEATVLTDYFDACRRKRNAIEYINSSVATETESEELLQKAQEFHALVEQWIATKQRKFTP